MIAHLLTYLGHNVPYNALTLLRSAHSALTRAFQRYDSRYYELKRVEPDLSRLVSLVRFGAEKEQVWEMIWRMMEAGVWMTKKEMNQWENLEDEIYD